MEEAIKNFSRQFLYEPKINGRVSRYKKFVIAGMGGSGLAGALLKTCLPSLEIIIHRDYGLPNLPKKELQKYLFIANSYSGNTEETLDFFTKALKAKLPLATISAGGKLLRLTKQNNVPYVQMPDIGIQPRMALGFNFRALLKILGENKALKETAKLSRTLNSGAVKARGQKLAKKIKNRVPVIYSSPRNEAIAYTWKIKFNETGKIPAFSNIFPEVNHNEMTGFDVKKSTAGLSENFHFIFLRDTADNPRIQKRMKITAQIFAKKKLPVEIVELRDLPTPRLRQTSKNVFHKIFYSLVLADWTSYFTAKQYGVEPEQVPLVEEFKKLIK